MYKSILVPIDPAQFRTADYVIGEARKLAGKDGRIILLSAVEEIPPYVSTELPAGLVQKAREEVSNNLMALAKKAGSNTSSEVRTGRAHAAILEAADQHDADLIMIASHHPGLQDYFLGSTAARVVRHANCSVLVMR